MRLVIAEPSTSRVHWQLNTVGRKQKGSLNEVVKKQQRHNSTVEVNGKEKEGFIIYLFLIEWREIKYGRGEREKNDCCSDTEM